jgi:Uma2 family endonuclease
VSTVTTSVPASPELADILYEVVNGQIVESPPMGAYPTWLASVLDRALGPFVRSHQLGRVVVEMLFLIDAGTNLQRRPDVAFVSHERWPADRRVPDDACWEVVPDLAVEVVSPTDRSEDLLATIREYFPAGVRRVWVVFPKEALVYDDESPTRVRILERSETLEAGSLLPGFQLPLTSLFEDEAGAL